MIESLQIDAITFVSELFFDPRKRLFIGYLLAATLIALTFLTLQGLALPQALRTLFSHKVWFSKSARADYGLLVINSVLFSMLAPVLLAKLTVATLIYQFLQTTWGASGPQPEWPSAAIAVSFTLFLFLLDDFARYLLHRLLHTVPWLWAFHKVHHSAETMTPLTVLRTHPIEGVLFSLRGALVQGLCIALFVYLFDDQIDLVTVLGASVIVFAFNIAGSNLRHSHIALFYWPWLERIFISPAQHQIHHSVEPHHFDKNFGAILAIWDRLGGSLHLSEPATKLQFGISREQKADHRFSTLYLTPFIESYRLIKQRVLAKTIPKKQNKPDLTKKTIYK